MFDEIIESELRYLQQCGGNRIQQMNSIGIFTLKELIDADDTLLKKLPGVFDWHIKRWKLQANLLLENQSLVLKKPSNPNEFIYYDIETDTTQNLVWLIGVYNLKNNEFKQFLAKTPKEEKNILLEFKKYLNENPLMKLCSYSGSRFDRRVIESRLKQLDMDLSPLDNTIECDLGIEIQKTFLAKVQNYKLRTIGDFFNYPWKHKHQIDGFWVAWTYEKHLRDKSVKINWNQLLEYNRDDVLVLPLIIKKMIEMYENSESF